MMKLLVFMVFVVLLSGCANEGSNEKPSAIDTSQHPTGITNSNVISTDTAAMRVDTTQK